jgi:hypothetical protein
MSNRFQTLAVAATLAAGVGTAAYLANAQNTPPPVPPVAPAAKSAESAAGAPPTSMGAAETKSPGEANKPAAWIGLPVVTADGQTLGQVTELKPSADGKSSIIVVKSPNDNTLYSVPSGIAKMSGRAVQLTATAQELKTTVQ